MALFRKKDNKEEKVDKKVVKTAPKPTKETTKKESKVSKNNNSEANLENVILKPRITEKAAVTADLANAYTFEVSPRATKTEVAAAIEKIYKVVPVKVNISTIPRKAVGIRRGKGFKNGGKKAIIYLKKGDKIDFV